MAPLFGTNTKSTTAIMLRGCSVELQGSSKVGIQDTLVFLTCLMCCDGHLFLIGDMKLDIFFYKIINGLAQVPFEVVLVEAYKGTRRKYNMKFRQIGHTTIQCGQLFFPKTISAWNGLAFAEVPSLAVFRSSFFNNKCASLPHNTLEGSCGILKRKQNIFVHIQIVEVDLALYHMYMLADWGHLPLIVSDGEQFASSMLCLIT